MPISLKQKNVCCLYAEEQTVCILTVKFESTTSFMYKTSFSKSDTTASGSTTVAAGKQTLL